MTSFMASGTSTQRTQEIGVGGCATWTLC